MNSKIFKKRLVLGISILCLAGIFAGCKGKPAAVEETKADIQAESQEEPTNAVDKTADNQKETQKETSAESIEETTLAEEDTKAPLLPNATGWAVQKYQDKYLSYEIPDSWSKNEGESSDEMMFAFFQSQEPQTTYPSNVNIQITQLNTGEPSNSIDYGSKEIQEEFHQFLLSDMGLPAEAAKGSFSVTRTENGVYVYSLGFERRAMDNNMVHQTIYLPMAMEHSIVIWATDFNEGAVVSADEAARHICETLEIIQ